MIVSGLFIMPREKSTIKGHGTVSCSSAASAASIMSNDSVLAGTRSVIPEYHSHQIQWRQENNLVLVQSVIASSTASFKG
jgi:hypothetical protein